MNNQYSLILVAFVAIMHVLPVHAGCGPPIQLVLALCDQGECQNVILVEEHPVKEFCRYLVAIDQAPAWASEALEKEISRVKKEVRSPIKSELGKEQAYLLYLLKPYNRKTSLTNYQVIRLDIEKVAKYRTTLEHWQSEALTRRDKYNDFLVRLWVGLILGFGLTCVSLYLFHRCVHKRKGRLIIVAAIQIVAYMMFYVASMEFRKISYDEELVNYIIPVLWGCQLVYFMSHRLFRKLTLYQ